MDFDYYQKEALRTDKIPPNDDDDLIIVPILGLAGEVGELLSEYKKHQRDGDAHRLYRDRVSEELGDLLWYLSNVASKFDLSLSDIAGANLAKVKDRWESEEREPLVFDSEVPEGERLPRHFMVELIDSHGETGQRAQMWVDGELAGDELTDNSYFSDGYRFHDVFHLAYAAVLGWSPVTRRMLRKKRKSQPLLDEVEDGGRRNRYRRGSSSSRLRLCPPPQFSRRSRSSRL